MRTHSLAIALTLCCGAAVCALAPAPARACPYDLLAMCCTQTNAGGGCTRWQNCCEVWKAPEPSGSDAGPTGGAHILRVEDQLKGSLIAQPDCVRRCDATSPIAATRQTCYASCATAPAAKAVLATPVLPAPAQGPGAVAAATPPAYTPVMQQLGGTTAQVPMKHGSCGIDCSTHLLASKTGNLDVRFKIEMSCPAGTVVTHLSYQPDGHGTSVVVGANSGASLISKTIAAQPFTASELEAACRKAMGGDWPTGNGDPNPSRTLRTGVHKSIDVWGQCSGWANKAKRTWPVALTLTCEDESFPIPPVG
jgi:hypothetical protein